MTGRLFEPREELLEAGVVTQDVVVGIVIDPVAFSPPARQHTLETLEIPSNVGGRFCVLTPAALLPLRLAGIDVKPLLRGAQAMAARCEHDQLLQNPAGLFAAIHVQHMRLFQRPLHVLMPYSDALRPIAAFTCSSSQRSGSPKTWITIGAPGLATRPASRRAATRSSAKKNEVKPVTRSKESSS